MYHSNFSRREFTAGVGTSLLSPLVSANLESLASGDCIGIPFDGSGKVTAAGSDAPQTVIDQMPVSNSVGGIVLLGSSYGLPNDSYTNIGVTDKRASWLTICGLGRQSVVSGGSRNHAIYAKNSTYNQTNTMRFGLQNLTVDTDLSSECDGVHLENVVEPRINDIQQRKIGRDIVHFEDYASSAFGIGGWVKSLHITGGERYGVYVPRYANQLLISDSFIAGTQGPAAIRIDGSYVNISDVHIGAHNDEQYISIWFTQNSSNNLLSGMISKPKTPPEDDGDNNKIRAWQ